MSVLWILTAALMGCLLMFRFADLKVIGPSWARLFLIIGAGSAGGMGLCSCLYFLVGVLAGAPRIAVYLELVCVSALAFEVWRRRRAVLLNPPAAEQQRPMLLILTAGGLVVTLLIAAAVSWTGSSGNPHGNWDAWAIWNLRAKFLASDGGTAARAWSPVLSSTTHPEYPLLVSGFVARCWSYAGQQDPATPALTSYLFFLALILAVTGGVTALRGPTLGLVAGISTATSPALLHEVAAQYADIPLACFMAVAVLFVLLELPALAGIFAGFAAWTKDEGVLFLVILLVSVVVLQRSRKTTLAAVAGAAPLMALVLIFKGILASGNSSLIGSSLPGALQRLLDVSRYGTVLAGFAKELTSGMTEGLYHPFLPMLILAAVLRFDPESRRNARFAGTVAVAMLAGYFGVYIVTSNDVAWQLQTSLTRLLVQLWPLGVIAVFVALRPPESFVIVDTRAIEKAAKKKLARQLAR
jgi:hypothetical protein